MLRRIVNGLQQYGRWWDEQWGLKAGLTICGLILVGIGMFTTGTAANIASFIGWPILVAVAFVPMFVRPIKK